MERSKLNSMPPPSPTEQRIEKSMKVSNSGVIETLYERAPPQVEMHSYGEASLIWTSWAKNPNSDSSYLSEPSLVRSNSVGIDSTNATQSTTASSSQEQASCDEPTIAETSFCPTVPLKEVVKKTGEALNDSAGFLVTHQNLDDMLENFDFEELMAKTGETSFHDQQQWTESMGQEFNWRPIMNL